MNRAHSTSRLSRRQLLGRAATGFPLAAFYSLLANHSQAAPSPLAARPPHFVPRAKRAIFLFMGGGPSHIDLFDPKPALARYERVGIQPPAGVGTLRDTKGLKSLPSPWKFRRRGQSGMWCSELYPHVAKWVDNICLIRSMVCDQIEHSGAIRQLTTGDTFFSRPSLGSWLLYGLGSENENLPGFVCFDDQINLRGGVTYGSSFLPAMYQGIQVAKQNLVNSKGQPIANLKSPVPARIQRAKVQAIRELDRDYASQRRDDSRLAARIASYELAFRMQIASPAAFDLSQETEATHRMYGVGDKVVDDPVTPCFAKQCLLARRLVERGVRFVVCNVNNQWDSHGNLKANHEKVAVRTDQPVAALLADLSQRGLLDSTLVIWAGEFGRTPQTQGASYGRDHHPYGFSCWLAGGGAKGGLTYGSTDDFGYYAVDKKVHFHDLHATILHQMGLDHTKLTYRYGGRDYRLTDVFGNVVNEILT